MDRLGEWISAGAAVALMSAAASRNDDFGARCKPRYKAKRQKTAASIKRAKAQKAQRMARKRSRK